MREGQNECFGNRLNRSVPEWSGWGGGNCWEQEDRPSPYGACREREQDRVLYRHRAKQNGHLCLKTNIYTANNVSGIANKISLLLCVKCISSGILSNDYDYVQRCEITAIVVAKLKPVCIAVCHCTWVLWENTLVYVGLTHPAVFILNKCMQTHAY